MHMIELAMIAAALIIVVSIAMLHRRADERSMFISPKPNVPDALVDEYRRRKRPGWRWQWTTVGADGRPQVVFTRVIKGKLQWHLVRQKDIKL